MKSIKGLAVAVGCVLAQAGAANAATIIYTSEAAFETAAAPTALETFTGGFASLFSIDSGSDWFFGDSLMDTAWREDTDGTVFTFNNDVMAFGGIFSLSRGGWGHGLRFALIRDGGEEVVNTVLARRDGFFGFTSTEAFSAVRIYWSGGMHNGRETYGLDNVRITAAPPAARGVAVSGAPEPMTWALMLAGFGGAGAALRRRKADTAEA